MKLWSNFLWKSRLTHKNGEAVAGLPSLEKIACLPAKSPDNSATANARYMHSPDVISQKADSETMLFCMVTGQYFSLNELGTRVWMMSDATRTPLEIASSLEAEYDVESDVLLEDVLALVRQLTNNGLLREQSVSGTTQSICSE